MKKLWKWLVPAFLILLGFVLRGSNATSFLGLISTCLAALVSVYYLLALLKKHRPKAAKILTVTLTSVVALGIAIVTVTGIVIAGSLSGDTDKQCDYIVVLGAKVNGTSPSRTLRERIDAAAQYLNAHPETVAIVSGGQGSDEGISEAQCMFNGLTDRGIAPERIRLEDQATSTWENLNYSLDLIEAETGTRPTMLGIVSSEFHLFRAKIYIKNRKIAFIGAKTKDFPRWTHNFCREIAGVWHYILLGGQNK